MSKTQHLQEHLQNIVVTDEPCSTGQPTWVKVQIVTKVPGAPLAPALSTTLAQVLDFYPEES